MEDVERAWPEPPADGWRKFTWTEDDLVGLVWLEEEEEEEDEATTVREDQLRLD